MDKELESGAIFLNKLYSKLHMSDGVVLATKRKLNLNPTEKIAKYINHLDESHKYFRKSERTIQRLKELYYKKYVIKPENIPESYFDLQKKIALEQGEGNIKITSEKRNKMIQTIIDNQKSTLDV